MNVESSSIATTLEDIAFLDYTSRDLNKDKSFRAANQDNVSVGSSIFPSFKINIETQNCTSETCNSSMINHKFEQSRVLPAKVTFRNVVQNFIMGLICNLKSFEGN